MAIKIFIDINIFVDFIDNERLGHKDSVMLFERASLSDLFGYVSESVLNTAFYLTRKIIQKNKFGILIVEMLEFIEVLPCSNFEILKAYKSLDYDMEDAVLYQIALSNKMDYFITNDIKDFKKISHPMLPVLNSKQMLALL